MSAGPNEDFTNEPVRVMAYEINEEDLRYDNVILEFINNPTPGLDNPS